MTVNEKRIFLSCNILISLIGVIYFIFKYFFQVETSFGLRPHSLTSSLLHLHIISVPLLVLIVGYIAGIHIAPKLRSKKLSRRTSGLTLIISFLFMVITGYLLQVGFDPEVNDFISIIHLVISALWLLATVWHLRSRLI